MFSSRSLNKIIIVCFIIKIQIFTLTPINNDHIFSHMSGYQRNYHLRNT